MTMARKERVQAALFGLIGLIAFLALWEVAGQGRWLGLTLPPFSAVLRFLADPARRAMVLSAVAATSAVVAVGYAAGLIAGFVAAVAAHFCPLLRPGLDHLSGLLHSIPTIALAPIFIVVLDRAYTGIALAAISVYFVVYVATMSGLKLTSKAGVDLFTVLGARRSVRFFQLELPGALPSLLSGLSYGVPVAFIGVLLGEWFGSSRGVGLLMVTAMQNFEIPLLWASVVSISAVSLCAYGAMTLGARYVEGRYR